MLREIWYPAERCDISIYCHSVTERDEGPWRKDERYTRVLRYFRDMSKRDEPRALSHRELPDSHYALEETDELPDVLPANPFPPSE